MAHFNFVISQNVKWGHAGFYIDCHRMTVPENILLQKSTDNNNNTKYEATAASLVKYMYVYVYTSYWLLINLYA